MLLDNQLFKSAAKKSAERDTSQACHRICNTHDRVRLKSCYQPALYVLSLFTPENARSGNV